MNDFKYPGYVPITLNQIREHKPCASGWNKLLAAQGKTQADDVAFPMVDILDSNGLSDCIWAMRCLPKYNNLWRKYAVWCARQVQHLMKDPRSIAALDVAWRHSDGLATDEELICAYVAAAYAAYAAANAAYAANAAANTAYAANAAMRENQANKLREILTKGEWCE